MMDDSISQEEIEAAERVTMHNRIEQEFTYHAPNDTTRGGQTQTERYERLRSNAKHLAHRIIDLVPPSRERSMALSYLKLSNMLANAGITITESDG